MRWLRDLFFLVLLVAGGLIVWSALHPERAATHPASGPVLTTTLHRAVDLLVVAAEDRTPYRRSSFGTGWADLDHDCRDTRAEVLARESRSPVDAGCTVRRGSWHSYDDDRTWTRSFDVQVDHLVPLAEAWDSGARRWNAQRRVRYANDLGDTRTLVPITTALNYAKSAGDPTSYLPAAHRCRYVAAWIAVKLRWRLSVDRPELAVIRRIAGHCPDVALRVSRLMVGPKTL